MRNELQIMLMLIIAAVSQLFISGWAAIAVVLVTLIFSLYLTYKEYRSREHATAEYQFGLLAAVCIAASFFLDSALVKVFRVFFVYFLIRFAFSVIYSDNRKTGDREKNIAELEEKVTALTAKVSEISSADEERKRYGERITELSRRISELQENSVPSDGVALVVASLNREIKKLSNRIDMIGATSPTYEELSRQISEAISASEAASSEKYAVLRDTMNKKIAFVYEKVLDDIYSEMSPMLQQRFQKDMDEMRKSIKDDISRAMASIPQYDGAELKEEILAVHSQLYTDLNTKVNELVEQVNDVKGGKKEDQIETLPGPNEIIENNQIRSYFDTTLKEATKEIDIICPWISPKVVDTMMIDKFERLLNRNVTIKILYGIGNINSQPGAGSDKRNEQTESIANSLRKQFKRYPNFKMKKGNTHQKIFICDEKFYVNSSFNILSFKGDYKPTDKDVRTESGEYSTDVEMIRNYREKYFDF